MDIGQKVKELREKKKMSQQELALRIGYKVPSTIQKIESGERQVKQSKILSLANALDTTPEYLLGWETKKDQRTDDAMVDELVEAIMSLPEDKRKNLADYIRFLSSQP